MDTTETSAALWAHVARKRLYSLLQWCQWRVSDRWTYQLNEHLHHFIVDDVLRVVHQQVTIGCVQHLTTYQRQTPKTWHQWRVHSKKLLFNLLFSFHKFSSGTASPGWSRKGQYNGCGVHGYYSVSVVASVSCALMLLAARQEQHPACKTQHCDNLAGCHSCYY